MPAHSFDLRIGTIDDARAIAPLMAQFNREEGIEWRPATMVPALERLLREPSLGVVVVAVDGAGSGESLAGYAIATFGFDIEFAGQDAFVTELFVQAAYRGAGIGRALLDSIVEDLRAREVKAVHLFVRPENERAKSLYDGLGFLEVPRSIMTRRLDAAGS